jgi:lysozyme family protein
MADFSVAYKPLLDHEGGYANNCHDKGGETYRGIARAYHGKWDGWRHIDRVKQTLVNPPPYGTREWTNWRRHLDKELAAIPALQASVESFYRANFWNPIKGDEISDQDVATWLLDRAVNCGAETAAKMLQRAVCVVADGDIGPRTLAATNSANPDLLLSNLREEARAYYRRIVDRDPSQACFLDGWLARC